MNSRLLRTILPLLILGAARSHAGESKQLDYAIVITGEELLRGVFPDAHTAFITRTLHAHGCHCVCSTTVDDKVADIQEAVRAATQKVPLVIVTGGLGPTVNDVTRDALAELTGIKLQEQPDVLAAMAQRLKTPRDQLRPNLRRQTMVPTRGTYLKAAAGTAVGLVFEWNDKVIVALPGPPRELQPMVKNELVPYLRQKFGVRSPGSSITLRFVGIGQSLIDQTMSQHVPLPPDVIVGSQFEGGRVDFEFMLPGNGPEQEARLKTLAAKIRQHLGDYIYAEGETTLEQHVAQTLLARNAKLTLVEIGSGGRLAASLAGLPETTRLLKGAHVAPSEGTMQELLKSDSRELKALAQAAGSEWAIVTGAIAADSAGARSCTVLFRLGGERWESVRVPVSSSGETAYASLVTNIWDRLRRLLK
ncbi:MAG: CinA family protein [Verrucomicrobia bacterium]|nr:CinA family protein [Verrucomicrobiota bacterium]